MPATLFEKIWNRHVVVEAEGRSLLYVDRLLLHEGAKHAFAGLAAEGLEVRRPDLAVAVADHYVPTRGRPAIASPEIAEMVATLEADARRHGILHLGMNDARQGIVHVVGPELGLSLPGMVIVCGDSHTATHGAMGALAFGIGASEVKHVLATQTLWQRRPKTMRITVDGVLGFGVAAKDLILAIIGRIGAAGATGHVIEYAGSAIRALPVEGRLTLCNMSIEAGGRAGMVAPDDATFEYLAGRPYAPQGAAWEAALRFWRSLPSDEAARFDREVRLDAAEVAPTVTWGTSPEDALPITGQVPDPAALADPERRATKERALRYMDLAPGTKLSEIAIDRVFIGSCTNARLDDLRAAARVAKGRRAVVPAMVSPGSTAVKRAAEAEGLDRVFLAAGFEWRDSGCSMCVGMNGDLLRPGERCAATSNRNFEGRQGQGGRTHLMSPAMAAAAAVTGRLTDVRALAPNP